ncbi:MAG: hypothetical protein K2Z81_02145 [Cyanobacteria bacterium]|nr:hypothetical protein [Cyanobacteriota bacterium]
MCLKLALLLAVCFCLSTTSCKASNNELKLGLGATVESVDVALNDPLDLDGMSKDDISRMREILVGRYSNLINRPYRPDNNVFGQITDGKPWWGLDGQFVFGAGDRSTEGKSEEARFVCNPFLLIGANPWSAMIWDTDKVTEEDLQKSDFPYYWAPSAVRYYPKRQALQIAYEVTRFNENLKRWQHKIKDKTPITRFGLVAYNARDFGYGYLSVETKESENLVYNADKRAPVKIEQMIHCGDSCGCSGGCNNMSPAQAELDDLSFSKLPATVKILLWRNYPGSTQAPPDLTVFLYLR